jgi:hypothetical protein
LIIDLEKDITKYKSKLLVITGDFFLSDPQITKQDKDWLYPQMIQAIKKVKDFIILVFSDKLVKFIELWILINLLVLSNVVNPRKLRARRE